MYIWNNVRILRGRKKGNGKKRKEDEPEGILLLMEEKKGKGKKRKQDALGCSIPVTQNWVCSCSPKAKS